MALIKVSMFECSSDNDAPANGFEVVEAPGEHAPVKSGDFLLDADVVNLRESGHEVIINQFELGEYAL